MAAQADLSLCWTPMSQIPISHKLVHLGFVLMLVMPDLGGCSLYRQVKLKGEVQWWIQRGFSGFARNPTSLEWSIHIYHLDQAQSCG